jgi:3-oxoacyl-ACP reductase-like protein
MLEQPLLSDDDAAPAPAAPAPAAPASAAPASASTPPVIGLTKEQKTLIITSIINLILNNISEEEKKQICHIPANKTANINQKLKDI